MAEEKANIPENEQPKEEEADIAAAMAALGKKFAEAMSTAWNSEERQKLQSDIKDGLDRFTTEVNKTAKNIRESEAAKKVETGVQKAAEDVKSGKVAADVRRGMVTALQGLSDVLDKMASGFTPVEGEDEPKE
jgi:vacuolar-type H+-ATPase subunit E/Vma4